VKEIQSDLHSGVHWQNHVAAHGTALSADHCLSTSSRVGVIITRDGPDTPAAAGTQRRFYSLT